MNTIAAILYHAAIYSRIPGTCCALFAVALFFSWLGDRKAAR